MRLIERYSRHQDSPINRAPVEVLCRIFLILLRSPPVSPATSQLDSYHKNRVLQKITAVCRRWRSTASECAILWTNIIFSTTRLSTIHGAQLFLGRSKNAMLWISIWDFTRPTRDPEVAEASTRLLCAISSQSHRILSCELLSPSPDFWSNWTFPAPNLRKLVVEGCSMEIPVFGGAIPQIETLTSLCSIPWPLGDYTALRKAKLGNYEDHPSLPALLGALQGCGALEKLTLHGYIHMVQDGPSTTSILLPRLRRLKLFSSDSALILGQLEAPSLVGPVAIYDTNPRKHILGCLPTTQHSKPYLEGVVELRVVFKERLGMHSVAACRECGCTAFYVDAQGIGYQDRRMWIQSSIETVASSVHFSNIRTLTVVTDSITVPWAMWFSNLTQVRKLNVSCPRPEDVLNALLTTSSEDGRPSCPSLRSIAIHRYGKYMIIDHVGLMELVLHRYQMNCPLRRLTLRKDDWEWIQQLDLDGAWVFPTESQSSDGGNVTLELPSEIDVGELHDRFYLVKARSRNDWLVKV